MEYKIRKKGGCQWQNHYDEKELWQWVIITIVNKLEQWTNSTSAGSKVQVPKWH